MAEELKLNINEEEFEEAQAASREASKASQKKIGQDLVKLDVHDIAALEKNDNVPKTDDSAKFGTLRSTFIVLPTHIPIKTAAGNIDARIKAIFYSKQLLDSTTFIPEGATFGVILDKTSFYAESGGQEYDTGNIVIDGIADFEVENVQVYNGYVFHTGRLKYGQLSLGDQVISSYDEVRARGLTF